MIQRGIGYVRCFCDGPGCDMATILFDSEADLLNSISKSWRIKTPDRPTHLCPECWDREEKNKKERLP